MSGPSIPQLDIDDIVTCFRDNIRSAGNEEDLRIRVSTQCIEEKILKRLGITQLGKYEYTLVSGARIDALYGHVIVEYKAPGKLSSDKDIVKAKEQAIKYIQQEAQSEVEWDRYLGIIISDKIAFVRYDKTRKLWILRGPYDIKREVIIKLIEAFRGLRRKALKVDSLLNEFGPESPLASESIKEFYKKLISPKSPRTKILFEDWLRLFKQATGYSPDYLKNLEELAKSYNINGNVKYDELIFAIQTYYALILKLLSAEVVYLYGGGRFYKSYIAELDDAYSKEGLDGLKRVLMDLENGGIFRQFGIENFLEGDYYSWYLDEIDKTLADNIAEIARRLSEFEPATPQLEPESARDLLKRLYQHLVPEDIRHKLGEYYTPDWLADFLLDEVGLSRENLEKIGSENSLKPLGIRILDPACGSGTFLVRYISRLRDYAREHFLEDVLVDYLLKNVVGYDLNPLAVLTARTNYLLMIADLPHRNSIEIPIYLTDSLMVERKTTLIGSVYVLKTVAGEFQLPSSIVDKGFLSNVLNEIANALRNKYNNDEFRRRIQFVFKELSNSELNILEDLYTKLLKLEREGKDDIWVSIIRNAFAPILKGKFDFIIGNPPWVNWENLPEEYRKASENLWFKYGLAKIRGRTGLGKVKKDLAMLFLARTFDLYLKSGGKQGFLLPFTVFKTQAGAGFRYFLATKTRIIVIHDMVTLYPFEDATNRTAAIVIEKICELEDISSGKCQEANKIIVDNKRIKHVMWVNKSSKAIPTDTPLEEVLKITDRFEVIMSPTIESDVFSPWMQTMEKLLPYIRRITQGHSYYDAHAGVYVALNQVYFVEIKGKTPDGKLVITNPPESGQKKKVRQVEAVIEPDLVYPLIRGRDVKKWYVEYKGRYIIIPHNSKTGNPLSENDVKVKFPLTYNYLSTYKRELESRSIHKLWGKENPFYSVYDIGSYTFAPYKVVWKEVSARMAAGGFHVAVVEPIEGNIANNIIIPEHTVIIIPFEKEEEAYYVAGVLNSIISTIYGMYMVGGMLTDMYIPTYDSNSSLHKKIVELSKKAHVIAKCIHAETKPDYCSNIRNPEKELMEIEKELDKTVAQLYGMPEDVLDDFRKLFAMLSGEEVPEESEEVSMPQKPSVNVLNTSLKPNVKSSIEIDVVNPSGKEIKFEYEMPWGKDSFSLIEGKYNIETPPLKPGKYEGIIKWTWNNETNTIKVTVEVSEPEGPKRRRTLIDV
ncbi:Eco57I restriction-modification methylase domain-containing protein [Saccharolobus shibatae]|uniref:site-specific DNA-methyltransferase (adenine-specific) n=1 Tax=Saccharolobus shibatae TaxID=2286 RepID=A0A8F5GYF2_9CREN|nr:N-6 DNA methylase [Saccharolobus shibatae]QXJ34169.1 Type IIL restriction-modification enzyme (methylase and endonucleases) [Saccharolobus shibatae]